MNLKILVLISLLFVSCNKDEDVATPNRKAPEVNNYDFNAKSNSLDKKDDFSDLEKKDDESCDTEEEITKKLAKPKQEAFQLQGGDSGCDVTGHEK